MTVIGIMLFLGLLGTFLGAALLWNDRKDRKAWAAKAEAEHADRLASGAAGQVKLVREGEEEPLPNPLDGYKPTIARVKLGMLLVCQGSLAATVAIGLFLINGFAVKIAWYITLPVAVAYFAVCLVADALLMSPHAEQANAEDGEQGDEQREKQDAEQAFADVDEMQADDEEQEEEQE